MKRVRRAVILAFILTALVRAASCSGTVTAQFGSVPNAPFQSFTINLVPSGTPSNISGFNFRIYYDGTQITLDSVSDNTGQPGAGVEYTLGSATAGSAGGGTNQYNDLLMIAGNSDLVNPTYVAQLNFSTNEEFDVGTPIASPNFQVFDVGTDDGLYDATPANTSHSFYSGSSGLPVIISKWELE